MKIDVILPITRINTDLNRAVKSVKDSKAVQVRIIAVDNSVQPNNRIKTLLDNSDVYIYEPKIGYAQAMNAPLKLGIDFSEFVGVMNDDDLIKPTKLISQVVRMDHDQTDVSVCEILKINHGIPIPHRYGTFSYRNWNKLNLLLGFYGADATILTRRNWFESAGYRNTNIHPDLVDYEYFLRNASSSSVSAVPSKDYIYRQHAGQMSRSRAGFNELASIEEQLHSYTRLNFGSSLSLSQFFHLLPLARDIQYRSSSTFESAATGFLKLTEAADVNTDQRIALDRLLSIRRALNGQKQSKFLAAALSFRGALGSKQYNPHC